MALDPENWMSHLVPSTRVIDTYIPASHDASSYPTTDADMGLEILGLTIDQLPYQLAGAVTQLAGYNAQLNAGVRYFDMRCSFKGKGTVVYMHHGPVYFQQFTTVLAQIRKFADSHPKEFLFLDIDFDSSNAALEAEIIGVLTQSLDERRFATAHVGPNGSYNTGLTWKQLADQNGQFIILWNGSNSRKPWAPLADKIRSDAYGNFDKHPPEYIITYLTQQLNAWKRDKLFVTQVVNTPRASPLPYESPADRDFYAMPLFNKWIMEHQPGSNLGIVKRDFVNAAYNREAIEYIIRLNKFTSPPNLPPLTTPIFYTDMIRLRTLDNRYVSLEIKPARGDKAPALTVVDTPTVNCNFLVRDYDYWPRKAFPYSGNMDADTIDCKGNFRMVHYPTWPPVLNKNETVLTVDTKNGLQINWGVGWGPSDDNETFTCFDPNNLSNDGQIYDGSRVMIRSMLGASSNSFEKFLNAVAPYGLLIQSPVLGLLFGRAIVAWFNEHRNKKIFWMTGYEDSGTPRIYAASPGTLLADTFIIEKVNF